MTIANSFMRLLNFVRILLVTLALSGYSAFVLQERVPKAKPQSTDDVAGIPLWRCADVETLWHDPSTLFVDVRSSIDYEFGHIRGAISVPDEEFDQLLPSLKPRLERAETIIVYCKNRDCGKSLWAAIRLRKEGLTQTGIYPGGWNEWFLHELPREGTGR
jgi:rhodanese-related sulfurtransferase